MQEEYILVIKIMDFTFSSIRGGISGEGAPYRIMLLQLVVQLCVETVLENFILDVLLQKSNH